VGTPLDWFPGPRCADLDHSEFTDAGRTECAFHAIGNGEIAGQRPFRWVGMGVLQTAHSSRATARAQVPTRRSAFLIDRYCVPLYRSDLREAPRTPASTTRSSRWCRWLRGTVARSTDPLITDIWRTGSGQSKRFGEPPAVADGNGIPRPYVQAFGLRPLRPLTGPGVPAAPFPIPGRLASAMAAGTLPVPVRGGPPFASLPARSCSGPFRWVGGERSDAMKERPPLLADAGSCMHPSPPG
jgi:hypothetical protein